MTPEEKAKDLIDKFSTRLKVLHELEGWLIHVDSSKAKGHALTAVDEILNHPKYQELSLDHLLVSTQFGKYSLN